MPPLRWVQTDGGPSIAVPYELRSLWQGSDPPANDYDSACEAARFVGLVRRPGLVALAIARGPMAWLPHPGGGVLVHWEYGESTAAAGALLRAALTTPRAHADGAVRWKRTRLRLAVPEGKLILFDAAYRAKGLKPAQRLLLTVSPGLNAVEQATFEPNESTALTLYRFAAVR